jgi:hypothetical protein
VKRRVAEHRGQKKMGRASCPTIRSLEEVLVGILKNGLIITTAEYQEHTYQGDPPVEASRSRTSWTEKMPTWPKGRL